jgi:serine/threonine protein phosphatase PrpC
MNIESCACTSVGRRDNNEDALLHLPRIAPHLGLFAVADGMGGYEGGEVASHLVVDTVEDVYRRYLSEADLTWPPLPPAQRTRDENLLAAAIARAHLAVSGRRSGRLGNMGSTVAALVLGEQRAVLGHVGDSRVYRWRNGELCQLTRDHSLFEEVRAAGGATHMQSKADCPFANVITRALGMPERSDPDVGTVAVQAGDVFLLCSDGLSDPLSEATLAELLAACDSEGVVGVTRRLVQAAYDAGGKDNITALIVRVRDQ